MNECKFCGLDAPGTFCGECVKRVQDNEHPVICQGCREAFGHRHSIQWIPRTTLGIDVQDRLAALEEDGKGVLFFACPSCVACDKSRSDNGSLPIFCSDDKSMPNWLS
jgi:hypothetical protein